MSSSKVLDVIIGLSFVYLLLSLIASALNELVAGLLGLRQSTLRNGVQVLLSDCPQLRDAVYDHPLVKSLSHGRLPWTRWPSYLPTDLFASALLDVLAQDPLPPGLTAVADQVKEVRLSLGTLLRGTPVLTAIDDKVQAVADAAARERKAVGEWFDAAMERVSGVYKRTSQIVILVLSLLVAVALNVDTVALVRALWTGAHVREAVAQAAGQWVVDPSHKAADPQQPAGPQTPEQFEKTIQGANARMDTALNGLQALELPVGWGNGFWNLQKGETPAGKLVGLLLTVIAISLGAPFWFDAIGRLVNVRAAGSRPGK
jgi:hypothetical protein